MDRKDRLTGITISFLGCIDLGQVQTHNLFIFRNLQEAFPLGPTSCSGKIRREDDTTVPLRDYV